VVSSDAIHEIATSRTAANLHPPTAQESDNPLIPGDAELAARDAELAARDAELAARDAIIKSILLNLSLK
jgi:hypothetical protein